MQVEYLSQFSSDLNKLRSAKLKRSIIDIINKIKSADSIKDIQNLKKLSGHRNAYRIRLGQYRIGIFINNNNVQFARVVHRKDIYKLFP